MKINSSTNVTTSGCTSNVSSYLAGHWCLHKPEIARIFPWEYDEGILFNSGDATAIADLNNRNNPGMGTLNEIYFQNSIPNMWNQYLAAGHRSSRNAAEFTANLVHLIALITGAPDEDSYIGTSLSLATCIRKFTSHLVLEDPALLQNQYIRCIRAIASSIFLIWHEFKRRGWVSWISMRENPWNESEKNLGTYSLLEPFPKHRFLLCHVRICQVPNLWDGCRYNFLSMPITLKTLALEISILSSLYTWFPLYWHSILCLPKKSHM